MAKIPTIYQNFPLVKFPDLDLESIDIKAIILYKSVINPFFKNFIFISDRHFEKFSNYLMTDEKQFKFLENIKFKNTLGYYFGVLYLQFSQKDIDKIDNIKKLKLTIYTYNDRTQKEETFELEFDILNIAQQKFSEKEINIRPSPIFCFYVSESGFYDKFCKQIIDEYHQILNGDTVDKIIKKYISPLKVLNEIKFPDKYYERETYYIQNKSVYEMIMEIYELVFDINNIPLFYKLDGFLRESDFIITTFSKEIDRAEPINYFIAEELASYNFFDEYRDYFEETPWISFVDIQNLELFENVKLYSFDKFKNINLMSIESMSQSFLHNKSTDISLFFFPKSLLFAFAYNLFSLHSLVNYDRRFFAQNLSFNLVFKVNKFKIK